MKFRITSIRPIGDIIVTEIEASTEEEARYLFYMDNPNSDITKISFLDEKKTPEDEKKVFEERRKSF